MQLTDALFNWLQIHIVWEARPSDRSAKDTVLFFEELLKEDHQVEQLEKEKNQGHYIVKFRLNGNEQTQMFPKEAAEKLLKDIISEPRYNQSFE
jgi:hypothetical protein